VLLADVPLKVDAPRLTTEDGRPLRPVSVVWAPQAGSQEAFLQCDLFEVLYEGTRGPGKTDALLMDYAQFVGCGYGAAWKGILFRQTYPQLSDVISKTKKWFPQLFPQASYNEAQHFWRWPTGEQLLLRQFQREDDYWNYHGHEYPWIGWEELCNWPSPSGFLRMQSTCRSSTPNVPKRVRSTTNPYGPGHNWVKHRYRLPAWRFAPITDSCDSDGRLEPPRVAIYGAITENKRLLAADPGYIDRVAASARNEAERKAWLEGSWDIVAGGMFDDVWDAQTHVVRPFRIPHNWKIDRSFDWGSSRPFSVGWWAESDGSDVCMADGTWRATVRGDLFRIAEWYGWNGKPNEGLRMLATDIARGIIDREVRWGLHDRVRAGPADSAIFDAENGNCIATDMGQSVRLQDGKVVRGVQWTRADKRPGSRRTGWEQMRKAFSNAKKPSAGGPREQPGLFIFNTCAQFLRTIPVLPRDQKDLDDVDSDTEDHIADETRYRVRSMNIVVGSGRTLGHH